ncbi:hypothetical protein PT015_12965 [Candidatus Mycobacterium wuenschmannii]|uniref:Secreted protein n=1 Tax=Candidatus Mycobacterium wuenschmannii TaxID=3027808 RepID=A0ABY8VSU8_9MYCO|nr:hypothetical protein [Candidatus Mycobacterium wuenschmannii]WIM85859.1 hypothetical protein PT015_12965 [Candidatus Mycobacterium wuenschmannii]
MVKKTVASPLIVGASALLLWMPVANADEPDCDQVPADQVQQCQQDKAAAAANKAIGETKQGVDQAKQAADQAKQAADQAKQGADQAKQAPEQGNKAIDLADKHCWLINGVPTMWSPGLFTTVGQTAEPCYSHFGLTPH